MQIKLVHILPANIGYVESVVDLVWISAEDTFAIDASVLEDSEDLFFVFQRLRAPARALARTVLSVYRPVTLYPVELDARDALSENIRATSNV